MGGEGSLTLDTQKDKDNSGSSKTQPQPLRAPEATSQQNLILSGIEGLAADCVLLIMFK